MQDIANGLHFSKAALYHHFESKDAILFEIMSYGMDVFEEKVLGPLGGIADPEARLRACISLHVQLLISGRDREITVVLHENRSLAPDLAAQINVRKKRYIRYLIDLIGEVQGRHTRAKGQPPPVEARVAAFALLGMINWMYQWYRAGHHLSGEELARQYTEILFGGIF